MMNVATDRLLRSVRAVLAAAAILSGAPALGGGTYERDELVTKWNSQVLQAIRDTGPPPTVVSRMLAIVHTCMYDAWAAYDDRAHGTVYGKHLRRPQRERTRRNERAAVSHAAFVAALDLLPSERPHFEALMRESGFDPGDRRSVPAWVGRTACEAVLHVRHRDGSNQLGDRGNGAYGDYTGYRAVNTPDALMRKGRWQPLRVPSPNGNYSVQGFTTPHWGRVRPFAIDVRSIDVKSPARYGSDEFDEQTKEIVSYSGSLTDVQKCVAEYWADGPQSETPPGHWNVLAQAVSRRDRHDLEQDVKMFFALNNALMDAGIEAWYTKRKFDYVRPISSVRDQFAGRLIEAWPGPAGGSEVIRGDDWQPYQASTFVTPPFPEYVSGHSTFSAAAARVLKRFTGSDVFGHAAVIEAGSSKIQPHAVPAAHVELAWATFSDAADEAGISRRYGGIHFRDGDLEGRRLGRKIGNIVWKRALKLFDPPRHHRHDD